MYKAEKLKLLAPEQYCSWKAKVANIQSLNKLCSMTLSDTNANQWPCVAMMQKAITTGLFYS